MIVRLHLIAEIEVDPLPTQDPVELARITLDAMRESVRASSEWANTLYEDEQRNPELFDLKARKDGVLILSKQTQEEIDEHIANDEFQCHKCNEWEDIEDSIEYKGEYYCQRCCVQASCGCLVPAFLVIQHDPGNGEPSITCCENCYDRIK